MRHLSFVGPLLACAPTPTSEPGRSAQAPSTRPPRSSRTERIKLGTVQEFIDYEGFPLLNCRAEHSDANAPRVELGSARSGKGQSSFEFEWAPSGKVLPCDAEQLVTFDVNFDGFEDFALPVANDGPYNSTAFQVFVYQPSRSNFLHAQQLSDLSTIGIGLFEVDSRRGAWTSFLGPSRP